VETAADGLRVQVAGSAQGDGSVVRVTLADPERRNAQTPATWRALAAVHDGLPDDVRVVVVDALGPSFCAGLDRRMLTPDGVPGEPSLLQLATLSPAELDATIAIYQQGFAWLADDRFVSVAAVQGHAVGAGFQLALACDLLLLADDAQLCMREPSLGLVPDLGGTGPLVQAVGYARALELCVTGRWMGADEAAACGLALRVVPLAGLAAAADELVAALSTAPLGAVRATKRLLRSAVHAERGAQLAAERREQVLRIHDLARAAAGR
jgi:enoyl-CoA hydratase/carnithine racemase